MLGADEAQLAWQSGHPGEAVGIAGMAIATTVNPEGGDGAAAARTAVWQVDNAPDRPTIVTNWVLVHK